MTRSENQPREYRLTQFSHGAGCGCKLAPGVLTEILGQGTARYYPDLLVGNETKDDAAVIDLDGQTAVVSTTDFFMPIVDDAYDFGAIAAANAISDIYAMGATPVMAIAILGWPIDKIPASEAAKVLQGARFTCSKADIPMAGGHSIDAPEPIFGLAVTGRIHVDQVKKNCDALPGDLLYLTKPLGIGILATAQKGGHADPQDLHVGLQSMLTLNSIGAKLSALEFVHAMTDVTGFGLAGHLLGVCEASGCGATLHHKEVPVFDFVSKYLALDYVPGGTKRNWQTYGHQIQLTDPEFFKVLADPQTSGGLLVSIDSHHRVEFENWMRGHHSDYYLIGETSQLKDEQIRVLA